MPGRREHYRHPDECRCKCHQSNGHDTLPESHCDCCWVCLYCKISIKQKIKPESHQNRCPRLVEAKSCGLDPTICQVHDPPKHHDHPSGCCQPCAKCRNFITDDEELLTEHLEKYCPEKFRPINAPDNDDVA